MGWMITGGSELAREGYLTNTEQVSDVQTSSRASSLPLGGLAQLATEVQFDQFAHVFEGQPAAQ
jgi:hypothetical protein